MTHKRPRAADQPKETPSPQAQRAGEDAASRNQSAPAPCESAASELPQPNSSSGSPPSATTPSPSPPADFPAEAEKLAEDFEKCFSRAGTAMPSSAEMAELHALQACLRELVRRASESGAGAAGRLQTLTAERDQLKEHLARARADFLNYQERAAKDLARAEELALRNYVLDLLPILDHLDLARADAKACGILDAPAPSAAEQDLSPAQRVQKALALIAESLDQALRVRGLEPIRAQGRPYDPQFHEAVVVRPADAAKGEEPNRVVEELRPGYLWKGLLLRSAQVVLTGEAEPSKKK